MKKSFSVSWRQVLALLGVFFLYSFEPIAAKLTSQQELFSFSFWLGLLAVVCVLGVYAVLWQQVLKHIPLSVAYMFRGSTLFFVIALSAVFLKDKITVFNCIGAAIMVSGMVLFSVEE